MEKTILVHTSRYYWGKGKSLAEALMNAKYTGEESLIITLYTCKPDELSVSETTVSYPAGTEIIKLTPEDKAEKISVSNRFIIDRFKNLVDDNGLWEKVFRKDAEEQLFDLEQED